MDVAVVAFQVSSSHTEVIFIFRYLEADSQMEVAILAIPVSSHTEVIFIFRYSEADSQMEVAVVAFQFSIHTQVIFIFLEF
jgi:hypothetical protein